VRDGNITARAGDAAMTIAHSAVDLRQTTTSGKRASSLKSCWRAFQAWRERERIRAELYSFSDRDLRDIGITHGEIDYFVSNHTIDPRGI
jgi:uncharacterized protein YjiS (DUF1127 family)